MNKFYYIYGKHTVLNAINNPRRTIIKISCNTKIFDTYKSIIQKFPYEILNDNAISNKLQDTSTHQGIIAKVKPIFYYNIEEIPLHTYSTIAILDQVMDPQNIGSIIRTAVAFNIDAIIMPVHHTPDESSTIAKVACGSMELLPIIKVTNLHQTMLYLKEQGFWIAGLDNNAIENINHNILQGKIAIVLGSEDKGLRQLTLKNCDYHVKIPISHNIDSLNVTAAATVAFYLSSLKN